MVSTLAVDGRQEAVTLNAAGLSGDDVLRHLLCLCAVAGHDQHLSLRGEQTSLCQFWSYKVLGFWVCQPTKASKMSVLRG